MPAIRRAAAIAAALIVSALAVVPSAAHDRVTTRVTWNREILPIIRARCAGCHGPGQSTTMPLMSYQDARPWAVSIKEEVLARRMPTWRAARGYGAFANDPSLSPFEIALIAAWADGGAPEGGAGEPASVVVPVVEPRVAGARTRTLPCGAQPLAGRLLAVRPRLDARGAAGIVAMLPDRREIVAWIRGYDPAAPTTYWLRTPLVLPRGSRLVTESTGRCTIDVTMAR